jgi:hypothetical protein
MTYTKAEYDTLRGNGIIAQEDYYKGMEFNTNQVLNSILVLLEKNDRTAEILPNGFKSEPNKKLNVSNAPRGPKTVASTPRGSRKKSKDTSR